MGSLTTETIEVAAGPLRTLVEALQRGRPLFWTGEVLVEIEADFPPSAGQATMVLDDDDMQLLAAPFERRCRECGCTEHNACRFPGVAWTCSWAEEDLCTACLPDASPLWQHPPDADRQRAA